MVNEAHGIMKGLKENQFGKIPEDDFDMVELRPKGRESKLIKQSWGMERERCKESMDGKRNHFLRMP